MTAPRIFTNFRKTALIAGIAVSLSLLWGFIAQLLTRPHRSLSELIVMEMFSFLMLVLDLPMPVFLIVLSRTGIRPSPSRALQYVLISFVAVRGVSLLLFLLDKWQSGIIPNVRGLTLPVYSLAWFIVSPGSHLWVTSFAIAGALSLISRIVFISFLVAFAKESAPALSAGVTAARQVKKAAVVAIVGRVVLMAIGVLAYIVFASAMRTYAKTENTPGVALMLRDLIFELPALIVPWIVYRGVGRSQTLKVPQPRV